MSDTTPFTPVSQEIQKNTETVRKRKVVKAIDIGFGFTKVVSGYLPNGKFKCAIFPSIVARSSKSIVLSGGYYSERETVEVEHNGVTYEVGPDIVMALTGFASRVLDNNYIKTDQYHVLMKGALKMMEVEKIDLLSLGVPVKNYKEAAKFLKDTWTGEIKLDAERKIHIARVDVFPQPLGGFAWHGSVSGEYRKYREQINLILDPGHFTFDWLVSDGMKMTPRSGSYEGGMSFIIRAVANSIGIGDSNLRTLEKLNEAIYKGSEFHLYGKPFDLTPHMKVVNSIVREAVSAMKASVGDAIDIQNIVMVGGGANLFINEVKSIFPKHQIVLGQGKSLANAYGFQWIGEQIANQAR